MVLVSEIKYEIKIENSDVISPGLVLSVLYDVKWDIGRLSALFLDLGLIRVLEVVESGKYELNGNVLTRIDLSSAKGIVDSYREYSEGDVNLV